MAYEPPQHDRGNLPERSNPSSNNYGAPKNAGDTIKTDPGDYSALPRSYLSVLSKSRPETYTAEIPNAGWGKTLLGIALVTLVSFGMKIVLAPFTLDSLNNLKKWLPTQGQDPNAAPWKSIIELGEGYTSPLLALTVPVTFFAGAALLYMLARLGRNKETSESGGSSFMVHSYLLSLSYTPLLVLSALVNVLSLVPIANCLGAIMGLSFRVYQIYSSGVSLQASQKLEGSKAQTVAFVPWIVGILLGIVVTVLAAVSLGSSILAR